MKPNVMHILILICVRAVKFCHISLFLFFLSSFNSHSRLIVHEEEDTWLRYYNFHICNRGQKILKAFSFPPFRFLRIYEKPISILILISVRTVKFCHISSFNSHSRLIVHEEEDTWLRYYNFHICNRGQKILKAFSFPPFRFLRIYEKPISIYARVRILQERYNIGFEVA